MLPKNLAAVYERLEALSPAELTPYEFAVLTELKIISLSELENLRDTVDWPEFEDMVMRSWQPPTRDKDVCPECGRKYKE